MSNSFGESARFSPRNVEKLASNTDKDRSYPMQTKDHWSMAGYPGHIPRHQDTFAEVFDVSVIEAETRYVTEQRGRGQSPRKNPDMADIGTTSRAEVRTDCNSNISADTGTAISTYTSAAIRTDCSRASADAWRPRR